MSDDKISRTKFRQDRFVQHPKANSLLDEMSFVYDLSGQNRRRLTFLLGLLAENS